MGSLFTVRRQGRIRSGIWTPMRCLARESSAVPHLDRKDGACVSGEETRPSHPILRLRLQDYPIAAVDPALPERSGFAHPLHACFSFHVGQATIKRMRQQSAKRRVLRARVRMESVPVRGGTIAEQLPAWRF